MTEQIIQLEKPPFRRWVSLALNFLVVVVTFGALQISASFSTQIIADLSISNTQYGLISTMGCLGYGVFSLTSGFFIEKLGARKAAFFVYCGFYRDLGEVYPGITIIDEILPGAADTPLTAPNTPSAGGLAGKQHPATFVESIKSRRFVLMCLNNGANCIMAFTMASFFLYF